jgi:hypothetical protein
MSTSKPDIVKALIEEELEDAIAAEDLELIEQLRKELEYLEEHRGEYWLMREPQFTSQLVRAVEEALQYIDKQP